MHIAIYDCSGHFLHPFPRREHANTANSTEKCMPNCDSAETPTTRYPNVNEGSVSPRQARDRTQTPHPKPGQMQPPACRPRTVKPTPAFAVSLCVSLGFSTEQSCKGRGKGSTRSWRQSVNGGTLKGCLRSPGLDSAINNVLGCKGRWDTMPRNSVLGV